jgi:hypothetical protein
MTRVYLECGPKSTFACALDWPGWCRRGKGDEQAVEELLTYAPRYAAAVGTEAFDAFDVSDVQNVIIVGRVQGNRTTDFGAPAVSGEWDLEPLDDAELARQIGILERSWDYFDGVVRQAPAELRKGPRGGGRDRDDVRRHVMEAERAYAAKASARVPPRTPWEQQRAIITSGLRAADVQTAWPTRYVLRRMAWHVLDHAWEIEDRHD